MKLKPPKMIEVLTFKFSEPLIEVYFFLFIDDVVFSCSSNSGRGNSQAKRSAALQSLFRYSCMMISQNLYMNNYHSVSFYYFAYEIDEDMAIAFVPCGHLVTCFSCAAALDNCPLCRKKIKGTVRIFFS